MGQRRIALAGALLAGLGVVLGAVGSHVLKARVDAAALDWWRTAAQYQIWHGLALLALPSLPIARPRGAAMLLGGGALLFALSLYLMALTGWRSLGALTPAGGFTMIAGWVVLAWQLWRAPRR